MKTKVHNRGARYIRTKFNPREAAFARAWEKENKPQPHINYGHGLLQDLFCSDGSLFIGAKVEHALTDSERMVAATAIQWLGSNCGWCFLTGVVKKCGYQLLRADPLPTRQPSKASTRQVNRSRS